MNKQRLCVPKGSFVGRSCVYWHDYQVDARTRITIQKCDFDRDFLARVSIKKWRETPDGDIVRISEYTWHQDTRGKTAVEALRNAMKLLEEMRS